MGFVQGDPAAILIVEYAVMKHHEGMSASAAAVRAIAPM